MFTSNVRARTGACKPTLTTLGEILPELPAVVPVLPFAVGQALPYAAIPHALIADERLIATDIRLAGVLLRYARSKATCWPSVATLARDMRCCERTVQYALARLKAAGWVGERPDGNPTGRVIALTWREGATPTTAPVQPYSQGLPRPQTSPAAPQGDSSRKENIGPPGPEKRAPRSAEEVRDLFADWLSYPEGHPLREMALRRIAARGD